MPVKDPRVDAYIAHSAAFAQPILTHLRKLVHQACPQVEETIKWGFPTFMHRGLLCGMAGFKQHCDFKFWKAPLLPDPQKIQEMACIAARADLPTDKVLLGYVRAAVKLNEEGTKVIRFRSNAEERQKLEVPDDLKAALRDNKKALNAFEGFSHSRQKEYVEWLTEAKTEATRGKRLATALEWMAEGKSRNWKYEKRSEIG